MDAKIVGQKIAKYRKEKNMTQQQLADELLVSNKAVSKWETGAGLPDIAILPTLATVLGVSVDDLVSEGTDSSSSKHQNVFRRYISKPAALISSVVIISIVSLTMVFVFGFNNNPEWSDFIYLHEFSEALEERGLQFINVSVYPHTTDRIDWGNPHIGRISEDIPIKLSTENDIDLLLAIYKIVIDSQAAGLSWDTSIDEAINKAGLDDYFMEGIREIAKYERERTLIFWATEHTFEELVEWGVFTRPGIMKDFHALGFFLDKPEDFETSIDDFEHGWVLQDIQVIDLPDGYHVYTFYCGCTYEGYWKNGLPNGRGKYTQPMFDGMVGGMAIIEGYFVDGVAHGTVIYTRVWSDRTWIFEFEADMGWQIEDSVVNAEGIVLPARFPLVIHLVMDHYLATNENWQRSNDLNSLEPPPFTTLTIPDMTNAYFNELLADERFINVFTFVIMEEHSDDVPKGYVIFQSPMANTSVTLPPEGDKIRIVLVVSIGLE